MVSDDPFAKTLHHALGSRRTLQHNSKEPARALGLDFLHAPKQETLTAALVQEDSSAGEMGERLTFFP